MKYSLIDGSLNLQSMLSLSFSNRCSEEEFSIYSHLQKAKTPASCQKRDLKGKRERTFTRVPRLTLAGFCGWLPVLDADDGQADLTLLVNVGVVDFCLESDLGWLERVLCREDDLNAKGSFVIRRKLLENKNKQQEFVNWENINRLY